jgi:hypothetical protein
MIHAFRADVCAEFCTQSLSHIFERIIRTCQGNSCCIFLATAIVKIVCGVFINAVGHRLGFGLTERKQHKPPLPYERQEYPPFQDESKLGNRRHLPKNRCIEMARPACEIEQNTRLPSGADSAVEAANASFRAIIVLGCTL